MECIYDSSYPDIWDTPSLREAHLFETEEDCCDIWNCHSDSPQWYPHFNSYDEVRLRCLRYFQQVLI